VTPPSVIHVGIDPGTSGAVAAVWDDGTPIGAWDMPVAELGARSKAKDKERKNVVDAGALARLLAELPRVAALLSSGVQYYELALMRAWIEEVGPRRGEGVSSVWTFARAHGTAIAVCEALAQQNPTRWAWREEPCAALGRVAVALVSPVSWYRAADLPVIKDKDERKAAYHAEAVLRWPSMPLLGPQGGKKLDRAAALFIADHGRRLDAISPPVPKVTSR
jgi:hypothetical protein